MCSGVEEIEHDFVVVNGHRMTVDPPFKAIPDKNEYETWLNEVMSHAFAAVGRRKNVPSLQDLMAQMGQRKEAD